MRRRDVEQLQRDAMNVAKHHAELAALALECEASAGAMNRRGYAAAVRRYYEHIDAFSHWLHDRTQWWSKHGRSHSAWEVFDDMCDELRRMLGPLAVIQRGKRISAGLWAVMEQDARSCRVQHAEASVRWSGYASGVRDGARLVAA